MKLSLSIASLLAGLLLTAAPASAQMNYQGRLTDSAGNPLGDGQYNIEFRVFSAATGGTELWGPYTASNVDLLAGRFNTTIGATDTASRQLSAAFAGAAFLQIKVGTNAAITPRQQILSAPKAMRADEATHAATADSATNFAPGADIFLQGSGMFGFDNSFTPPPNFGIGTRISYGWNSLAVGGLEVRNYANSDVRNLVIQGSGGNVIIGNVANPANVLEKFTVVGAINNIGGSITSTGNIFCSRANRGFHHVNGTQGLETWLDNQGGWIGTTSSHNLILETNNTGKVVIDTNGRMGLGNGSAGPTRGFLEVNSSASTSLPAHNYHNSGGALIPFPAVGSWDVSIWASNDVAAQGFRAYSDARIKTVQGRSDSAADLRTVSQIEVTDYKYKDTVAKGDRPQKKLIAQQVEKVFPQAVSLTTGVVPDIYKKAGVANGWVQLATDLKPGERIRILGDAGERITEVLETRDDAFRTAELPEGVQIFVYGREVQDFRTVDYEAVAMLNVSATQELNRQLQQKDEKIASLEKRLAALETAVTSLAAAAPETDARAVIHAPSRTARR